MSNRRARNLLAACSTSLIFAAATAARADEQAVLNQGQRELQKAVQSLQPHASFDTNPVDFSVAGTRYRVPRNYIVTMDNWAGGPQGMVTLRVTVPDMQPLDQTTKDCLLVRATDRPAGCQPLDVSFEGQGAWTAEQQFHNMSNIFQNKEPLPGPSGLERFDIGPEEARGEEYRKISEGRFNYYSCQTYYVEGVKRGFCKPNGDRTDSGTELDYFFDLRLLPQIVEIDANLRRLVDGFAVK